MATTTLDRAAALHALAAIHELIARQRARLLELARRIHPGVTERDLRHLEALPDVRDDPRYRFEVGQLAALRAARIALESQLADPTATA